MELGGDSWLSVPDLAFSEMRFLQKPRRSQPGASYDPPAPEKRSKGAKKSDPQEELSTFFATVKKTPKPEDPILKERPNVDESSNGNRACPTQESRQCLVTDSSVPMASDPPSSHVPEHGYPETENCRSPLTNVDDRLMTAATIPLEQTTPRPNTMSTFLSEPIPWSSSPPRVEHDGNHTRLGEQSYQKVVLLTSCDRLGAVPERQSSRSWFGHELHGPNYAGLYQANIRSGSVRQPNQPISEASNAMKGFWRPHKLY